MTTGISLVRENARSLQPPRLLWVPFPMGRPLGKPADPEFQLDVIEAALALLARESGPVLEDYPRDAPPVDADAAAPACPVSFARPRQADESWASRLADELALLKPWYDLGRRRRDGRTLVGISERTPEDNVVAVGQLLDEHKLPIEDLKWFKLATEDLKVFYIEALTAQPGEHDHHEVQQRLWRDSALGAALIEFYRMFRRMDDPRLNIIARIIVPREAVEEATGEEVVIPPAEWPR